MYGGLFGDLPTTKKKKESSSSSNKKGGGLFGDLPAAKKGSSDNQDEKQGEQNDASFSITNIKAVEPPASSTVSVKSMTEAMIISAAATKNDKLASSNTASASQSSFLKTVGSAGTSMAFVPAAARRKKRPRSTNTSTTAKVISSPAPIAANINVYSTTPTPASTSNTPSEAKASHFQASMYTTVTKAAQHQESDHKNPEVIDIHQSNNNNNNTNESNSDQHQQQQSSQDRPLSLSQSQVLAPIYEILDVYDPYVPNDLLQYLERKTLLKQKKAMEDQQRQAVEDQRLLRAKLEEERHSLQEKGDYTSLLVAQQTRGRGRGRGRGVSNLPAWLVEKQRKEKEDGLGRHD